MKSLYPISLIKSPAAKIIFLSGALLTASCDSFVEVELPKSQLTRTAVFSDYTTADAAMADIYSKMRDTGLLTGSLYGLSVQMGCYADELDFYGSPSNATVSFHSNAVLPANTTVSLFWSNSFNQIYAVNSVLEGLENADFNAVQKAKLKGEALFVRALLHFYLMQLFGDIPYIAATDYSTNSNAHRMEESRLYENITADLKEAEKILPAFYSSDGRVRANAFAAKAVLSRVYLYRGMWEDAAGKSSEVISNSALYALEASISKAFLKNSSEAIWQFMPSLAGKNTDEASIFVFTAFPPPFTALHPSLVNSFDADDLRKTVWITKLSSAAGTWYYASKYKESKPTSSSLEYSVILRLAEQYLIRAEARAQLSDLDGAREDLNKIRRRAGLSDTAALSKEELLEAVLEERRKELFTEYGHRFFDLKRHGKLDAALGIKPGWNSTDRLLPLPESELGANPNLKPQNPGY